MRLLNIAEYNLRASHVTWPLQQFLANLSPADLFVERSQHTLRSLYVRALPGPLAWAPSFLVPAAAGLSIFGGVNGHHLLHFLQGLQVTHSLGKKRGGQFHIDLRGIGTLMRGPPPEPPLADFTCLVARIGWMFLWAGSYLSICGSSTGGD